MAQDLRSPVDEPGVVLLNHKPPITHQKALKRHAQIVDETYTLELVFGADSRGSVTGATVEIYNVTDARQVLAVYSVVYDGSADWLQNEFTAGLLASDVGDTFEIRFHEPSGSGGAGLQLTNLQLIATVPVQDLILSLRK